MNRITYLTCILAFTCAEAIAETPQEALKSLSAYDQKWVNESCSRSLGPSLWSSCVRREVDALRAGVPDISTFSAAIQSWIRSSCSPSLGPSLAISCMQREKAAIEAGLPDLSKLTREERAWLDESCSKSLGPALYRSCVVRESRALIGTTPTAQAASEGKSDQKSKTTPPPEDAPERSDIDMNTNELFGLGFVLVIGILALLICLTPIFWVLSSNRSQGGAKFGWFIVAVCFSWISLAAFLILTQKARDKRF